jgi:GNAT superfamily N-acetyltransferase
MPPDPHARPIEVRVADPEDPAARACLSAYLDVLVARVDGITLGHVSIPDPYADNYRPPHGAFLLAWSDRSPLGCVSLHTVAPGEGEVKRLWIAPEARGQGLARRLMREIESQARTLGLHRLRLDTNEALTEAIALYRSDGWVDVPPYTGYPATHWFAKPL